MTRQCTTLPGEGLASLLLCRLMALYESSICGESPWHLDTAVAVPRGNGCPCLCACQRLSPCCTLDSLPWMWCLLLLWAGKGRDLVLCATASFSHLVTGSSAALKQPIKLWTLLSAYPGEVWECVPMCIHTSDLSVNLRCIWCTSEGPSGDACCLAWLVS